MFPRPTIRPFQAALQQTPSHHQWYVIPASARCSGCSFNAGKKKEKVFSLLKKWFPQMENFSGQLKKYNVMINNLLAENEKLKARASESGKIKDHAEKKRCVSQNRRYHSRYRRFCFSTKNILKIRSRPQLEPSSDYHYLVRITGVEPAPPCED